MIVLSAQQVGCNFVGSDIFHDVTFDVHDQDRIGIVGRNGCGKSSLARIIAGFDKPDAGTVSLNKGATIGYLAQIPTYADEMKVIDVLNAAFEQVQVLAAKLAQCEALMGTVTEPKELDKLLLKYGSLQESFTMLDGYAAASKVMSVANGLQISHLLESPFVTLSGGVQTKICLGYTLLKNPTILLLDEPTNHLDIRAVEWLEDYLRDYVGAVIIISHDRYFLDKTVTKIADIEDGELTLYHGNYSAFAIEKEKRLIDQFKAFQEQQSKMKKIREAIKRLREWANQANPPSEALHRRATNMQRALDRMVKIKKPVLEARKMGLALESGNRSGKDVVTLTDISKGFAERTLFAEASMHIQFGDHVAIVGDNGSGKSTILKMILGEETACSGIVHVGSQVRIGYLSQHLFTNDSKMTVLEALRDQVVVTEGEARNILAKFLFYGANVFQKVGRLSGGERMRLRLAQLMYQDINFLILDEPTNHLDIDSREVLEEALEDFEGTVLVVSHDRYLLNKLFNRTYWIQNGQLDYFPGNYSWARERNHSDV